jgi:hypothetical protein
MYLRRGIVILSFFLSHGVLFLLMSSAIPQVHRLIWEAEEALGTARILVERKAVPAVAYTGVMDLQPAGQ